MITNIGFKIGLDIILFCVFYFGAHLFVFGGIKQLGKGFLLTPRCHFYRVLFIGKNW